MRLLITFLLSCCLFFSCSKTENETVEPLAVSDAVSDIAPTANNDSIIHHQKLKFGSPIIIDSTDWVLYHLSFNNDENYSERVLNNSKKNKPHGLWNIAFYNIKTKEHRLLSENLKMLIHNYDYSRLNSTYHTKNNRQLYYLITSKDYNKDGKLTNNDPQYLYSSNVSGKNFKQISPNNHHIINYKIIDNKILIQTIKDTNQDKVFNEEDDIVNFIYDQELNKIEKVFNKNFNLKIKKILLKQWQEKEAS